jgi:hypothetical protein
LNLMSNTLQDRVEVYRDYGQIAASMAPADN